jgi:hypothetical protein
MSGQPQIRRACRIVVSIDRVQAIAVNTTGDAQGLTCRFTVKKDLTSKPNTCDLTIYNLNADHRLALQRAKSALVQIDAGYVGATSTLFLGDLRTTYSQREGADWVTQLSAGDGEKAIQTARVNVATRAGGDISQVLDALVRALGVSGGNVAQATSAIRSKGLAGAFSMGTVLSGSASREMTRILGSVGYTWSVQSGALQLVQLGKSLEQSAILVDETHGMVGSPSVDKDGVVSFRMLIPPDALPGRKIVLKAHELSGQFILQECTFTGDTSQDDWYLDGKGKPF